MADQAAKWMRFCIHYTLWEPHNIEGKQTFTTVQCSMSDAIEVLSRKLACEGKVIRHANIENQGCE